VNANGQSKVDVLKGAL